MMDYDWDRLATKRGGECTDLKDTRRQLMGELCMMKGVINVTWILTIREGLR
jgi:hypothetical protein